MTDTGQLLASLNDPQRDATAHVDGPLLILAGAGSGKTRVLTHRAAALIQGGHAEPGQILCVTFTNKACGEMAERIDHLAGNSGVWVRTFHSFGLQMIRSGALGTYVDPGSTVLDDADQRQVIRDCMKSLDINSDQNPPRKMLGRIEAFKRKGQLPEDLDAERLELIEGFPIVDLYFAYQNTLQRNRSLDFGDLLLYPVRALAENPTILAAQQRRFKYVMVDEFQDTNWIQYSLVKLLVAEHNNLAVVGDDDQSIYAWRGADISNILGFEADYPSAKVVRLEQNYRSTRVILDAAWQVVRRNNRRKEKRLWTERDGGDPIRLAVVGSEREEAEWIAGRVRAELQAGTAANEIAVFYRTNAQSRILEEVLRSEGISYRIFGATGFYDRREIRDVVAYLRLIHNPYDWVALQRVINVPRRGVGKTSLDRLLERAQDDVPVLDVIRQALGDGTLSGRARSGAQSFVRALERLQGKKDDTSVAELTADLLGAIDYRDHLSMESVEIARDRTENIDELLAAMRQFEDLVDNPTLGEYLDSISLVQDNDEPDNRDVIHMMTLHSAKGLEYDVVFMTGLEENILPHSRSLDDGNVEEERRLCYVGMTRARKRLSLSRARTRRTYGSQLSQMPSRFLDEIPGHLLQQETVHSSGNDFPWSPPRRRSATRSVAAPKSEPKPAAATAGIPAMYQVGKRLYHPKFGIGTVQEVGEGNHGLKLKIRFADGTKTILPKFVELKPA